MPLFPKSNKEALRERAIQQRKLAIIERRYGSQIAKVLSKQANVLADKYKETASLQETISVSSEFERELFDVVAPMLIYTVEDTTKRVFSEAKSAFALIEVKKDTESIVDNLINSWLLNYSLEQCQLVNDTTINTLRVVVADAVLEGLAESDISNLIIAELGGSVAKYRGAMIARTEAHVASQKALLESVRGLDMPTTKKKWIPAEDERTRSSHSEMWGKDAIRLDERFDVGGESMEHPSDPSGSAGNVINCLLPDTIVSCISPKKIFRRRYVGEVFDIKLDSGHTLSVTPNHPIMTQSGWTGARHVYEGQKLAVSKTMNGVGMGDLNIKTMNTKVSDLFDSFVESGHTPGVASGVVDFHGDIADSDVEIIDVDRHLMNGVQSHSEAFIKDNILKFSETAACVFGDDGPLDEFLFASLNPFDCNMSVSCNFLSVLFRALLKTDQVSFTAASDLEAELMKASSYNPTINPEVLTHSEDRHLIIIKWFDLINDSFPRLFISQAESSKVIREITLFYSEYGNDISKAFPVIKKLFDAFASFKCFSYSLGQDFVSSIRSRHYDGYVYNLEDNKIFYSASTVVNHNCRCVMVFEEG